MEFLGDAVALRAARPVSPLIVAVLLLRVRAVRTRDEPTRRRCTLRWPPSRVATRLLVYVRPEGENILHADHAVEVIAKVRYLERLLALEFVQAIAASALRGECTPPARTEERGVRAARRGRCQGQSFQMGVLASLKARIRAA